MDGVSDLDGLRITTSALDESRTIDATRVVETEGSIGVIKEARELGPVHAGGYGLKYEGVTREKQGYSKPPRVCKGFDQG